MEEGCDTDLQHTRGFFPLFGGDFSSRVLFGELLRAGKRWRGDVSMSPAERACKS
jgi:hypothetical protein